MYLVVGHIQSTCLSFVGKKAFFMVSQNMALVVSQQNVWLCCECLVGHVIAIVT